MSSKIRRRENGEHVEVDWDVRIPLDPTVWTLIRHERRYPVTRADAIQWSRPSKDEETRFDIPMSEVAHVVAALVDWMGFAMTEGLDEEKPADQPTEAGQEQA